MEELIFGILRCNLEVTSSEQENSHFSIRFFLSVHKCVNRELWILRRGLLRERDFLDTKKCTCANQLHFGGKMW